jgi:hypothetical protein
MPLDTRRNMAHGKKLSKQRLLSIHLADVW